jgi:hypothetical protein
MYLIALSSYNYGLMLLSYPQTKAISKHSSTLRPPYLTKERREEYRIYLMEQENETNFMYWYEWELAKVFKKTITQLEKESKNPNN